MDQDPLLMRVRDKVYERVYDAEMELTISPLIGTFNSPEVVAHEIKRNQKSDHFFLDASVRNMNPMRMRKLKQSRN